jgi:hypothetical protein
LTGGTDRGCLDFEGGAREGSVQVTAQIRRLLTGRPGVFVASTIHVSVI